MSAPIWSPERSRARPLNVVIEPLTRFDLTGQRLLVDGLVRNKRTPSLGGLGSKARADVLRGAIGVMPRHASTFRGAQVLLVEPRRLRDRAAELLDEEAALAEVLAGTWGAEPDALDRLTLPFDRLLASSTALVTNVLARVDLRPGALRDAVRALDGKTLVAPADLDRRADLGAGRSELTRPSHQRHRQDDRRR